ncbi:hypothetical protein JMUB6875_32760 [Nocardia sp. JMUB6875]
MPGDKEQGHGGERFLQGQFVRGHLTGQRGDQILAWPESAGGEVGEYQAGEIDARAAESRAGRDGDIGQDGRGAFDAAVMAAVDAEDLADHRDREWAGEGGDQVDGSGRVDGVDEFGCQGVDSGRQGADRAG